MYICYFKMKLRQLMVIVIFCTYCEVAVCKSVQLTTRTLYNVAQTEPSGSGSNFVKEPCFGSLHCVHGRCRKHYGETQEFLISECLCEPNWTGLICDQRQTIARPSGHQNPSSLGVPEDDDTTHGALKTTKAVRGEGNTPRKHVVGGGHKYTTDPNGAFGKDTERTKDDIRNICGANYKLRTLEERSCIHGLLCRFGTCSSDHKGSYIAYKCHCDKGAIGIFCDHKCCLECGKHGRCELFENGTQYCNCMLGYSGEQCQLEQRKSEPAKLTLKNDHYHWAVIVGVLIAASLVFLTAITTYFIWKRWLGGKISVLDKVNCKSNKVPETHYQFDVTVWYDNNETDDKFVQQVLLPLLEQSAQTFRLYTQSETGSQQEETDETLQRTVDQSYIHIVVYSPRFAQHCPRHVDLLMKKQRRKLQNRLVCFYGEETNKTVDNIKFRFIRLICRNVFIRMPDVRNECEVSIIKEKIRNLLPTKTMSKRLSIASLKV